MQFMKKIILYAILVLIVSPRTVLAVDPATYHIDGSYPEPLAKSAVLMDAGTGRVLYSNNIHQRLSPASVTKIMTALLVVETGHLDQPVIISPHAAQTAESTIYLQPGENLMRQTLLYACMLNSANDAATALAESVAGTEEAFVQLMNQRAAQLGMVNTHFCNPHGLDDKDHYTSAYDLALATRQALTYDAFRQVVATKSMIIPWAHHQDRYLVNQNRLLYRYPVAIGVKTGYTKQAGNCVAGAAQKGDMTLIAVALNSPTVYEDLKQMLDYGFSQYQNTRLAQAAEVCATVKVLGGVGREVTGQAASDLVVPVKPEEKSQLRYYIEPVAQVMAPVEAGETVGVCRIYLQDAEIGQVNLLAGATVEEKPTRLQQFVDYCRGLIAAGSRWHFYNFSIVLVLLYFAYDKKGMRLPVQRFKQLLRAVVILAFTRKRWRSGPGRRRFRDNETL